MKSSPIELSVILKDTKALIDFVETDFNPGVSAFVSELEQMRHYISRCFHNRFMKYRNQTYTLYGKPVKEMFAYSDKKGGVCLYICVNMSTLDIIYDLVKDYGEPENDRIENMKKYGLTFCLWRNFSAHYIYFSRAYGSDSHVWDMLFKISNIPMEDLHDSTLLFSDINPDDIGLRDFEKYPKY